MGMYTGIRFKGYVKPKFRNGFDIIALNGDWDKHPDSIFNDFGSVYRSSFIPCGSLSYMPDEWDDNEDFARTWNPETGYWTFDCSLKNYEGEIQQWLAMLPYFIDSIEHLEYYYEEDTHSQRYDFIAGSIYCVDEKFIEYNE